MPFPSLGDKICFLSAARYYARAHPDEAVHVSILPEVVERYEKRLLTSGISNHARLIYTGDRARVKHGSKDLNYVGTYAAELGLAIDRPLSVELPSLKPLRTLSKPYVALQSYSGFAANPPRQFIQRLVDTLIQEKPKWRIIAVGRPSSPKDLQGVSYDFLGSPLKVLRIIQHAALVLTPRSATAHIAAGYRKLTFVWLPNDGENWHLDYPDWCHMRQFHEDGGVAIEHFKAFLQQSQLGHGTRES